MNSSNEQYHGQQTDISDRANEMKKVLLHPILGDSGKFITESATRAQAIESAVPGTLFAVGGIGGAYIAATASNALRSFCTARGFMPSDDLLAAAHRSIETILGFSAGKAEGNLILESATLDTTEGIQFRNRMVALILPVMLQTISSQMVGFLPGNFNRSEIFRLYRTAGTTFGDVAAGDRIDQHYKGQYGTMDQRYLAGTGNAIKDGVANEFKLDSNVKFGKVYPMKKTSVRILHDRNVVAADDGKGNVTGTFKVGATTVNVTGTVNYVTGIVNPVFSVPPAVGIEIHTAFDVDIEKAPGLIPTVNHELDFRVLIPHEAAIAAETTLQALWYLRREMNINSDSMAMMAMRNLLAADKDRKALAEMMFFAQGSYTWNYTLPAGGISPAQYFDTLLPVLLQISSEMLNRTQISGLVGLVADTASASKLMSSTRGGQFVPAPGYQPSPQPHYAGRLFGMFDLYVNPQAEDFKVLGFGKGSQISHCGYMAGDAIPAMAFKHAVQSDLNYKNTLWELSYRDLQPFDGRDYLTVLTLEP